MLDSGQLSLNHIKSKVFDELTKQKKIEKRSVAAGHELVWEFSNVKPLASDPNLFVRFKFNASDESPDRSVYARWAVGDLRQLKYGTGVKSPIYTLDRHDSVGSFHEMSVPADAVADDGYLGIAFLNAPLNNTVINFTRDGIEILYKKDTFTANYIRAVLLVLLRMIFLACLAILASSFLSFPVAILLCMVVFSTAHVSEFVIDSFGYMGKSFTGLYSFVIAPIVSMIPKFDVFNPTKFLITARLLSWPLLARAAVYMCMKAVILLLLALLIFRRREIAKITA